MSAIPICDSHKRASSNWGLQSIEKAVNQKITEWRWDEEKARRLKKIAEAAMPHLITFYLDTGDQVDRRGPSIYPYDLFQMYLCVKIQNEIACQPPSSAIDSASEEPEPQAKQIQQMEDLPALIQKIDNFSKMKIDPFVTVLKYCMGLAKTMDTSRDNSVRSNPDFLEKQPKYKLFFSENKEDRSVFSMNVLFTLFSLAGLAVPLCFSAVLAAKMWNTHLSIK